MVVIHVGPGWFLAILVATQMQLMFGYELRIRLRCLDQSKMMYIIDLSIGSSGDVIEMEVDTGSSHSWIPSIDLQRSHPDRIPHLFDPSRSTTFHTNHSVFHIDYADQTTSDGISSNDLASFHPSSPPFPFHFGLVSQTNLSSIGSSYYGVLALRPDSLAAASMLKRADAPIIAISYRQEQVDIGRIADETVDKMIWAPIISSSSWAVEMDSITLGYLYIANRAQVQIDTGSTIISVPRQCYETIMRRLGANALGIVTQCRSDVSWPDFVLHLHGKALTIDSRYWIRFDPISLSCSTVFRPSQTSKWSLGIPVLHPLYTVFKFPTANAGGSIGFFQLSAP